MRVVNSARLWDNRKHYQKRLPKRLFFAAIALGIGVAAGVIVFINKPAAQVADNTNTIQPQVEAAVTDNGPKSLQLLPQQDALDAALKPKLFADSANRPVVDCTKQDCLALTFDDGPDPKTTPAILNALRAYGAHATFFLVGSRAGKYPALVQRIALDGNEVGNHSFSHTDFKKLNDQQIKSQIEGTQNAITRSGAPAPTLFRPPYGSINPDIRSKVSLAVILWNIDPEDWKQTDPKKVAELVENQAKAGGILIMHDMHPATATAIAGIVHNLSGRFKLVTVSELLNLTPADSGKLFFGR